MTTDLIIYIMHSRRAILWYKARECPFKVYMTRGMHGYCPKKGCNPGYWKGIMDHFGHPLPLVAFESCIRAKVASGMYAPKSRIPVSCILVLMSLCGI